MGRVVVRERVRVRKRLKVVEKVVVMRGGCGEEKWGWG